MEDKTYIDNQIQWMRDYTEAEFKAVREAVDKVEKTNELYRASQNEWRGTINDQANTFARSETVEFLKAELADVKHKLGNFQGRVVGFGLVWTILLIILTYLISKQFS